MSVYNFQHGLQCKDAHRDVMFILQDSDCKYKSNVLARFIQYKTYTGSSYGVVVIVHNKKA